MDMQEKISLVIPCFNERSAIEETIDEVNFLLGKVLQDIVVVDDGSFDGTYEILKNRKDITLVRNPYNKGYGYSIKKGIMAATGNIVAITDADGTYPIESILLLVKKLEEGYDLVIGKRDNLKSFDPFLKKLSRFFFKKLAEFVAGEKILDVNSGLRAFRKDVILKYFPNTSSGFSFSLSTTLIFILDGLSVYYYPIEYRPRVGKSKVKYLRDILRSAQILVETITLYNPIKIFMLISGMISFLGFIVLLIPAFSNLLNSSLGIIGFMILQGIALYTFSMGLIAFLLKKRVLSRRHTDN
ncbi:MAG: glycosyltransferase family 2 protein [Candidatus Melainabacteria bacterium]|nr:glycosyltransferase family 2 protein [Candidatus Melainabacteria bacterium]